MPESELVEQAHKAMFGQQYDLAAQLYLKDAEATGDSNSYYNAGLALSTKLYPEFSARKITTDNPEYKKIVEYNLKALELSKYTHGRAFINLGKVYEFVKAYDQAIPLLKRGMTLPKDSNDWYSAALSLGSIYMGQQNAVEAVAVFEEILKAGHSTEMLHNKLGACYFFQNQFIKATEQYEKVLQFNPQNATALEQIKKMAPYKAREQQMQNTPPISSLPVYDQVSAQVNKAAARAARTQEVMAAYQTETQALTTKGLAPAELGAAFQAAAAKMQQAMADLAVEFA